MNETINYREEVEKLGGEWLKLGAGYHKITFLEEIPAPIKKIFQVGDEEKEQYQSTVSVEYQNKVYRFTLTKGLTKRSLWGQLVTLGYHLDGLKGKSVTILVKSDGNKKDYTVLQLAMANVKTEGV